MRNLTVAGGQSEGLVLSGVRPGVGGSINVSDSAVRDTWGGSGIYDKATDVRNTCAWFVRVSDKNAINCQDRLGTHMMEIEQKRRFFR